MHRINQALSWLAAVGLLWVFAPGNPGSAAELRYGGAPDSQFAFEITITVDAPDRVTTLKGITRYKVRSSSEEQIQLIYQGGLTESIKPKGTAGPRRGPPFGPGGLRPPSIPDPFGRAAFRGKTNTTNEITLTPRGAVLAMKGDSQLPYLLGNVSLLPFEVLPPGDEKEWKYDSGVSIEQKNENGRGSFGRFGPFAQENEEETQAGEEGAEYTIQSQNPNQVVIKKTYRLKTPGVDNEPSFEMTGSGTWTWNHQDHWPEAYDFKLKLLVTHQNTQTTIPISIVYHRLSPAAIAKLDQEAQQRLQEMQKKQDEEKQRAEAPLTPEEKKAQLGTLASADVKQILDALKFLKDKSPQDPDSEVAAALERLLHHPNTSVRDAAKAALMKWSPAFERKEKLNAAYTSHMPVESTNRSVDATTPLYVGQIIQFQEFGPAWFAGEILALDADGKVTVRDRGFTKRVRSLPRKNLQLAPDELDQPNRTAVAAATPGAAVPGAAAPGAAVPGATVPGTVRSWLDATGQHRIEAAYAGFANGKVQLKRTDGKEISVPLDKLSEADQKFVREQQAAPKTPNPFDP